MKDEIPFIMNFFPLHIISQTCAWISLIFCVVVLTIACLLRLYSNSFGKLICGVLLGNILSTFPKVLALFLDLKDISMCQWLEAIEFFGRNSNFLWSMCFAHASYTIVSKLHTKHIQNSMKYYTLISTIVPLILSISLLFTDYVSYEESVRTCVHEVTVGEVDLLYILFADLPLMLVSGLSIYFYFRCLIKARKYFVERKSSKIYNMLLYPAIMLLCWLPSVIINILMMFGVHPGSVNTILWLECMPLLQGFFDALTYGVSKQVLTKVRRMECIKAKPKEGSFVSEADSRITIESKQHSLYEQFQALKKDEEDEKVNQSTIL